MPRGVKKTSYHQTHGFEWVEEFPEHAKMNSGSEGNWAIREFLAFLYENGIFLARYDSLRHKIEGLPVVVPERLLMQWREVDPETYAAEQEILNKRYNLDVLMKAAGAVKIDRSPLPDLPEKPTRPAIPTVDPLQDLLSKVRKGRDASQD